MSTRNHEITTRQNVLNPDGSLREPGYSKRPIQIYSRDQIKASKFRIKEWDYYLITSNEYGLALTMADLGYVGMLSASLLDFRIPWEHTETALVPFPMGRFNLPASSTEGHSTFSNKRVTMEFFNNKGSRDILCTFKNFLDGKTLSCEIHLDEPEMDSMVISIPWKEDKKAFYYNRKINCMRADGQVKFDGKVYKFDPCTDFGCLDWGRGVWTYKNRWLWATGSGLATDGVPFGFNLGYGFGDNSAATENIVYYDGVGHKLDDVEFIIPPESYMLPWKYTSSDGRFEGDFYPIIDRQAKKDLLKVVVSDQHQVFGRMTGRAILDDGRTVEFKDFLCSCEDIYNQY